MEQLHVFSKIACEKEQEHSCNRSHQQQHIPHSAIDSDRLQQRLGIRHRCVHVNLAIVTAAHVKEIEFVDYRTMAQRCSMTARHRLGKFRHRVRVCINRYRHTAAEHQAVIVIVNRYAHTIELGVVIIIFDEPDKRLKLYVILVSVYDAGVDQLKVISQLLGAEFLLTIVAGICLNGNQSPQKHNERKKQPAPVAKPSP